MADALLYEISKSEEMDGEPFIRRENVYIIDQNNGSYTNNQIIMDCASVSNSGKWADFANAYMVVPLLITLTSTYDFSAILSTDFAVGLKNGFHQLVSSLNVEYNNTSVVQISNFTNVYISYKLNTTLSLDDVVTIGSQIGFKTDSAQSWSYTNVASATGNGSSNNTDAVFSTDFSVAYIGTSSNNGLASRQLDITFTAGQTGVSTLLGASWASVASQFTKNYTTSVVSSGGRYGQAWNILASIRLKDMADFFAQMPLTRNAYIKMYVNLNQSLTTFTCDGTTGVQPAKLSVSNSGVIVYGGNTNPLLLPSTLSDCGFEAIGNALCTDSASATFTCSVSVLNTLDNTCPSSIAKNPMLSACRLYINLYTMNYQKEEEYLQTRTKTIRYKDIFQYQFLNVTSSFNFLVSNGISGLKEIVIVPFISASYNGSGSSSTSFSVLRSPFASEPATCSPLMWFNNFNIQISGVNVFTNNEQYGFEQFQNELYGVGSINGGLVDGMTSGLISQTAFFNNYGYLVADVARRLPEDTRTPKSVQISGTCLSQVPIDLYVFCVFEKSITIDLYSGKRLE
jgi:hypothetical protein